jgi:hypothetical protein
MEIWKSFDVTTQARLFLDQVSLAKDARNLGGELAKYRQELAKRILGVKEVQMEEAIRAEAVKGELARAEAAAKEDVRIEQCAAFVKRSLKDRDQKIAKDPSTTMVENARHNERCTINRYLRFCHAEGVFDKLDKAEQARQHQLVEEWAVHRRLVC